MAKYLFLAFGAIAAILAAFSFLAGAPRLYEYASIIPPAPHLFNNPKRGTEHIRIAAFYFIPKNKERLAFAGWQSLLEENLGKLKSFHSLQFQGHSSLSFTVYPEPIIGLRDQLFYDTGDTARGNPKALLSIAGELEARVFDSGGDLHRSDFRWQTSGAYPVMFILYEGVGASGGIIGESGRKTRSEIARELGVPESVVFLVNIRSSDGFFLLSRAFLSEPEYRPFGASLLAHEFYHTLGVPDGYDVENEIPKTADIMGLGRFRPIEKTYLQRETLRALGL